MLEPGIWFMRVTAESVSSWPYATSIDFHTGLPKQTEATLRLSRAGDIGNDPVLANLLKAVPSPALRDVAVCSFGDVDIATISTDSLTDVCRQAYRASLEAGIRSWVVAVPHSLAWAFERLGFRRALAVAAPATQRVMALDLFDVAHLWSVHSPLLDVARDFAGKPSCLNAETTEEVSPSGRLAFSGLSFDRNLPCARTAATQARARGRLLDRRQLAP
jgi:hypothetical protein